tara:strand:- start:177 stop:404 length:228 start_codon:yes stop_codon:yes gene_type:complete
MLRKGLLMWIYKDDSMFYIKLFKLFGLGLQKLSTEWAQGARITIGIWKMEFGFHLIKKESDYGRIKDETSPQASA